VTDHEGRTEQLETQVTEVGHLALLGEVAAGLMHDMSQPLQVIEAGLATASDILALGPGGTLAEFSVLEGCVEDTKLAIRHLRRLSSTIRRLVQRTSPRLLPLHLRQVVEDALLLQRPRLARAGVVVRDRVPDGLPPVLADPARIAQVLFLYLGSAGDATPGARERRVTVSAKLLSDGWQALEVSDSGPRGPAGREPWSAEAFGLSWAANAETGLGQAIVRRIAADHRARTDVRESEDGGARFRFLFPPHAGAQAEVTAPPA